MATEGQQAKREGTQTAALHADTIYRIRFNNRLADLAEGSATFTSEDVTMVVGIPNDKVVGALMSAAATSGYIRKLEYVPAGRPNQHAAMITRWTGTSKKIQRVLLAEDETVKSAHWVCTSCQQPASVDPAVSLVPDLAIGKCLVCKRDSTFRRVGA